MRCFLVDLKHERSCVAVFIELAYHSMIIKRAVKGKPMRIGIGGFVTEGTAHVIVDMSRYDLVRKYIDPRNGLGIAMLVSAVVAEANVVAVLVAIGKVCKIADHTQIFKGKCYALLCGVLHKRIKA